MFICDSVHQYPSSIVFNLYVTGNRETENSVLQLIEGNRKTDFDVTSQWFVDQMSRLQNTKEEFLLPKVDMCCHITTCGTRAADMYEVYVNYGWWCRQSQASSTLCCIIQTV